MPTSTRISNADGTRVAAALLEVGADEGLTAGVERIALIMEGPGKGTGTAVGAGVGASMDAGFGEGTEAGPGAGPNAGFSEPGLRLVSVGAYAGVPDGNDDVPPWGA